MNSPRRGLSLPIALIGAILVAASSYSLGKIDFNPIRNFSLRQASKDSIEFAGLLEKRCKGFAGDVKTNCFAMPLDSLAAQGQVRVAMGTLARLGTIDVDAKREGHVLAHGVGITGGKRGGDIGATFAMCDASNSSGCYHGVIQAYFAAAQKVGPDEVNRLCDRFRTQNSDHWLRFQCVHGTGHGLEMFYNHSLPKALAACDFLLEDWDRRSCYGGAFMENVVNFTMPHHPGHDLHSHVGMQIAAMSKGEPEFKAIDPSDPLYPCSVVATRYWVPCYEMQTSVILYLNHGDLAVAAKTCDTAPRKMRFVCYQSLGRDIGSYSLGDHTKARQMCSLGTGTYQPWCYFGLAKNFVDLSARPADGFSFCKSVEGDSSKLKCYEAVGEQVAALNNGTAVKRSLCTVAESAYRGACLFGARVSPVAPAALEKLNAEARVD
jgi:hypothetical protein